MDESADNMTPAAHYWLGLNERSLRVDVVLALAETVAHRSGRAIICRNDLEAARELDHQHQLLEST